MRISRIWLLGLGLMPLIELALLAVMISRIGWLATIGMLVVSGLAGLAVIRHQGLSGLLRSQELLARGQVPAAEMVNTGITVSGGILLMVPGVLSDVLALPCLIPSTRSIISKWLINRKLFISGVSRPSTESPIIEGQYHRDE